jgi:small subunit ribosomal protein S16
VVADSRTHRDGRVIEEIGRYVPTNDPSIIEVNSERAQYWLSVGAQPTEQAAVLLKLTGDLANAKGEKKNTVKPQQAKEAFAVDTAKKSVVLPKVEKKAPVVEEAPAAEAAVEAPASEEVAVEEVAVEAVAEVEAAEAPAEAVAEEVVAEAPAEEAVAEEAPAAEAEEPKAE